MNLVIPMLGRGGRFADAGFDRPKPFVDVAGKMMVERVLDNLVDAFVDRIILIVRRAHLSYLDPIKAAYGDRLAVVVSEDGTDGTACSVLLARHLIDNDETLCIANSDQLVFGAPGLYEMMEHGDAWLYTVERNDPAYSYAELNADNRILRLAEKEVISNEAVCGVYFLKHGRAFCAAASAMIAADERVRGEFYISPVISRLCPYLDVRAVRVQRMYGMGTPEALAETLAYLQGVGA